MTLFCGSYRPAEASAASDSVRFCDGSVRNRTGGSGGAVPTGPVPVAATWLSLGTNVGERRTQLARAIAALPASGVAPTAISRLYATAPVDMRGRWFLNCVVRGETALTPLRLLRRLRGLERALGRRRLGPGYQPRPIDIDILLYDGWRMATRELALPHPGIGRRRFLRLGLRDLGVPLPMRATAAVRRQALRVEATSNWWSVD